MFSEFVDILAAKAGHCYSEMTGGKVIGSLVREARENARDFSAARVTSFEFVPAGMMGRMVIGLCDAKEALDSARAMADAFSCPPPASLNGNAVDLLSEFLTTVVGASALELERRGFFPQHDALASLEADDVDEERIAVKEFHEIVINQPFSRTTIKINFEAWPLNWFGLKQRVLVVDDSMVIRTFLGKIIAGMGLEFMEAGDGQAAIEAFLDFHPHLTLMDLIMPKMGGLEAIEAIKKSSDWANFLILTSTARADQVLKARKLGVTNYLLKPPQEQIVIERVTRALPPGR
ncbi:MAG: response regulator [Pseudomonadota bacterium]